MIFVCFLGRKGESEKGKVKIEKGKVKMFFFLGGEGLCLTFAMVYGASLWLVKVNIGIFTKVEVS